MARQAAPADELEHLDPLSGAVLAEGDASRLALGRPVRSARSARLRRWSAVCAVMAVFTAGVAVYVGTALADLRDVEHLWRQAMALDAARAAVDARIIGRLDQLGDREDPAGLTAMGLVGDEASRRLGVYQDGLRGAGAVDGGIDRVRDQMVAALRFRRFQMTPNRLLLGDTPLRKADRSLDAQLRRWHLAPRPLRSKAPTLRSTPAALAALASYANAPTGALLVGSTAGGVVIIDVDASTTLTHDFGYPVSRVDTVGTAVLVTSETGVDAYRLPDLDHPVWQQPGFVAAVAGQLAWIQDGGIVRPTLDTGDLAFPAAPLPAGGRIVGATADRLVLLDRVAPAVPGDGGAAHGRLQLWWPYDATVGRTLTEDGRLVATSAFDLAWQTKAQDAPGDALDVTSLDGHFEDRGVLLPRTDAGTGAFSPDRSVLAFTAGPIAGDRAAVLTYHLDGSALRGLAGPSAAVTGGVTWSGSYAFWLTPEGRIAMQGPTDTVTPRLLRIPELATPMRSLSAGHA